MSKKNKRSKPVEADRVSLSEMDKRKRAAKKTMKAPAEKLAGTKPPKAKLSCLDAAAQVLASEGKAMNCKAMINAMHNAKLWTSDAPTPAATLYSAILRELNTKGSAARFKKVDRGEFTLAKAN